MTALQKSGSRIKSGMTIEVRREDNVGLPLAKLTPARVALPLSRHKPAWLAPSLTDAPCAH